MTRSPARWTARGAALLAVVMAAAVAPGAAAASTTTDLAAAADEPVVVLGTDFEDGTWAPWTQSGAAPLSVVDVDGGKALLVSGRAADYEGIQSPTGLLEPGASYTFSMRARLAEGTEGSAGIRFVVKPDYTWVGNTTMTADAWTTVTGSFTAPAAADPATLQVYLGTGDLAAPYDYLVDDLVLTAAGGGGGEPDPDVVPGGAVNPVPTPVTTARGTGNVAALTFDDGPNPGETDDLLDLLAENDLTATFCVIGQNVQAEGGAALLRRIVDEGHTVCNHTTTYADMGSWTPEQIRADLARNLAIIREAAGDPELEVPYFRAPNGSWGATPAVAVELGMQPLGLGNVISDWDGNDLSEETLTANLRAAVTPGAVVLVHDGGGDRANGIAAVRTVLGERLAEGWTFTLPTGGAAPTVTSLSSDFEDGLDGWVPRGDADGDPTVEVTTTQAHGGTQAALVTGRTTQGDGIGRDVTGLLTAGTTYDISAWVRFGEGAPTDDVWLSLQRTSEGATTYDTVAQLTGVTSGAWHEIRATYQMPEAESAFLYLETSYPDGSAADLLVDDVVISAKQPSEVQDLTPLQDTVDFPVGVAIDSRETTGPAAELLLRHFDQITGENHMKPEAWYTDAREFRTHPEATTLMEFAQENDVRVYGHTLVWHSQTPAWFFTHEDGTPLTTSEADKQELRMRMRTHIFDVAEALSTGGGYGLFGSETNPVVAFDVVNEVVSDGRSEEDGLRRSEWYRVLGEEFIDLAFRYADEAFNGEFAVEGERPVTLTINDYNTEQVGKQQRLHALVERLLARDVPVDAVGHQFHVSLAMPVQALEDAIVAFDDLGLTQVVSELDVTTGTPVTQASLIEQGYYYRDAFRIFREHAEDLFSVTVWGLTDGRSWRVDSGAPLLFDDALQAKPAYYGAVDGELSARQRAANAFRGDVAVAAGATGAVEWRQLPLQTVEDVAGFSVRWEADHLSVYARVTDATVDASDAVTFVVGEESYTVGRNGEAEVEAVVEAVDGGYAVVAHLPRTSAEGDQVSFDVRVTDGESSAAWNQPGVLGTLTLVEALSTTQVVEAAGAPVIDGQVDAAWASANAVTTDKQIEGEGGATANVRTLWRENTLYVLAEVTDPTLDATGSDPWVQDSLEIFLDAGNVKNGPYRYDDTQIRISYLNEASFGTGDEAFQQNRLVSQTSTVAGGYVVEASISLLEAGGVGTFHGLDFQVNDATAGARTAVRAWADPTGRGYQSTARWGVAELVPAVVVPEPDPSVTADRKVRAGDQLEVTLEGYLPSSTVDLVLERRIGRWVVARVDLGDVTVGADGSATTEVRVPRGVLPGKYTLRGTSGEVTADTTVTVQLAKPSWWWGWWPF